MAFGFVGSHVPESLRLRVLVVCFIGLAGVGGMVPRVFRPMSRGSATKNIQKNTTKNIDFYLAEICFRENVAIS